MKQEDGVRARREVDGLEYRANEFGHNVVLSFTENGPQIQPIAEGKVSCYLVEHLEWQVREQIASTVERRHGCGSARGAQHRFRRPAVSVVPMARLEE